MNILLRKTLKGSLLQITYFTAVIGILMLAGLGFSLKSLFEAKTQMSRSQEISIYLERVAVNLGEITAAMRGYLLDNTASSEWQDRNIAEESAVGNLSLATSRSADPDLSRLLEQMTTQLTGKLKNLEDQFGELITKDAPKAKKFYLEEYSAQRQEFDALMNLSRSKAKDMAALFDERHNRLLYLNGFVMGGLLLLTVLAIIALSLWIAAGVNRRIQTITDALTLSEDRVCQASEHLLGASEQLSAGATQAAASLEETMSSVEELSSMVNQNALSSKEASEISLSAKTTAENGESEVGRLIESMGRISAGSKQIEDIINVIDDIAFQTNLLALNAAVEAARAGEQGKGFAVVAEAVRSLAQRSSSAAKDISRLIKESVTAVDEGSKIADTSGLVLKDIVASVRRVSELNNAIAGASREQATGISQIASAMGQLDEATQTNAGCAEQVAAASQEMTNEAALLETQVENLVTMIGSRKLVASSQVSSSKLSRIPSKRQSRAPLKLVRMEKPRQSRVNSGLGGF